MKHTTATTVLLWIVGICGFSQSADQNYIVSRTYNYNTTNGTDSAVIIQYYDGLGRPIQTVQKGVTPQQGDLAAFTEYDAAGREWKHHLPVKGTGNGNFVPLSNFTASPLYDGDSRAFSETIYEPSPLNRVTAQKGPGAAWDTHPVTIDYQTNASGEVKLFTVSGTGQLINSGTYAAATLYKTVTKDEDNKPSTEYKDKLGRVVMQRQGTNVDTYYVYNDLGQLAYVLPPLAADAGGSADAVDKYGYVYKYDERGNCIYKKLPGCEPIFMVYDKADRMVLSQDGNQRAKKPVQWTVTKYDAFGRIVYTGILKRNVTDAEKQQIKNNVQIESLIGGANEGVKGSGYTCALFSEDIELLTVNYYDNYDFLEIWPAEISNDMVYQEKEGYSPAYSASPFFGEVNGCKGLLTATVNNILNTNDFTYNMYYYDERGNVVQTRSTNHLGGYDIVYNDLDFTGKPNKTLKEHNIINPSNTVTEIYSYYYDHAGRLLTTNYKLNDSQVLLSSNEYDELGRLIKKNRHNGTDTESFVYNIRNWTTQIKSGGFEENIYYNSELPLNATPYYNGNISYSTWTYGSNNTRGYQYNYDALNRYTGGYAYINGVMQVDYQYSEGFTYNKMGNITHLVRNTFDDTIDQLYFSYNGNQVSKISDSWSSRNQYSIKEYQDKTDQVIEFTYDANGNLTTDLDRDIATIKYNLLNLPDTIQFRDGHQIINRYDASGQKLQTEYFTLSTPLVVPLSAGETAGDTPGQVLINGMGYYRGTKYAGNIEYAAVDVFPMVYEYIADKIYNPEGYTLHYDYNGYYYYRKDHLGNIREVWQGGRNRTLQRTQYYPSGLPWAEGEGADVQQRKYNGKEWIEAHGLDEYDSQARMYYPAIMRTTTIDPLAEKYYSISPYAWCGNNPVNRVDPDGMIDYNITTNGYIVQANPIKDFFRQLLNGKDKTDRLIPVYSSNGKPVKNVVPLELPAGILGNMQTLEHPDDKGKLKDGHYIDVKNNKLSNELFEFVSENTNVEWSLVESNKNNILSTYHDPDTEPLGTILTTNLINDGQNIKRLSHSHPVGPTMPYGGYVMVSENDKQIAKYYKNMGQNILFRAYNLQKKRFEYYNENGIWKYEYKKIK